jgi:hypothetical protein
MRWQPGCGGSIAVGGATSDCRQPAGICESDHRVHYSMISVSFTGPDRAKSQLLSRVKRFERSEAVERLERLERTDPVK